MRSFIELIHAALDRKASALILMAGQPATLKLGSGYAVLPEEAMLTPGDTEKLTRQAYDMAGRSLAAPARCLDEEFAISVPGLTRLRIYAYRQRNSYAMNVRIIPFGIPSPEELGIPAEVMRLAELTEGLVLVTGPAGSGNSTTLAALTDAINHRRSAYILTVEDPIEYLFKNDRALISQREIGLDAESPLQALRSADALTPDVLLVSRIPDGETLAEVLRLSNAHPLVLTAVTARTPGAALNALLAGVSGDSRGLMARELSLLLKAVVCQTLEPDGEGRPVPHFRLILPDERQRQAIAELDLYRLD